MPNDLLDVRVYRSAERETIMNIQQKEKLETLATNIEAKRQDVRSDSDLTENQFASLDSYNLALTEAAELVRAEIEKDI